MKKRVIALLTASIIAMSFVGCGSDKNTTTESSTTVNSDVATEQESMDDVTMAADRGTITNNVYTNRDFDISFPIPSDCRIYSDEEITQILGLSQDILSSSGNYTASQMEQAMNGTFYDIWYTYPDGQSNVYLAYENMNTTGTYGKYSAEDYSTSMKQQFSSLDNYGYSFDPDTTEVLGGASYVCINAKTETGIDQKIYIRQVGNYMLCITLSYSSGDTQIVNEFTNSVTNAQ